MKRVGSNGPPAGVAADERFRYEVIVAGAGPAGLATAVGALRAEPSLRGRILAIDRASFPRGKPCGGGLTGRAEQALAALGLRLEVPSVASPGAVVRYGRCTRAVALPRPVRTVRREEFDLSLLRQARRLGVEVREATALEGFAIEAGGVTVRTSGGEALRARVLVGAEGVGSLVRAALEESGAAARHGAPPDVVSRHGTARTRSEAERGSDPRGEVRPRSRRPMRLFHAEIPDGGRHRLEMVYDFTPMLDGLRGYLWIFPAPGGRLNVGLMHDPAIALSGGELAALLRERLRDHQLDLDGAAVRGWPAWGYRPAGRVAAPHLLTVGDAAGIDALTGEGITVSLEQGRLAGAAIARALASGDLAFAGYQRALRRAGIGRELALDGVLARMLYAGRDHRRWLSLVMYDDEVLRLYAARVSGATFLADRKAALLGALLRHLVHGRGRLRRLRAAET